MAIRHYVYAAGIAAGLALLAACGDDVTEVTEVNGKASFEEVKKFKELPKCDEDAEGSLVYVKDSAKVFVCTGDGWNQLDGSDGKDGKNGSSGDDGSNCVAKQNKKKTGFDVICDGKMVGSIMNGSDGKAGKAGSDGSMNCSAKQNKKKNGFDIVCDGKTVGTITNGSVGEDCSLTEGENGTAVVKCGEDGEPVTLFSAYCGAKNFDPTTQFCGNDLVAYPLCHNAPENLAGDLHSDGTYDVENYFCDATDILLNKCFGQSYDNTTQFCASALGVMDRCESVAEGVDEEEALFGDKSFNASLYFCNKGVLYEKCGGMTYDPELQFCEDGEVQTLCGGEPYDIEQSMCVDGEIVDAWACCYPEGQNENWCNLHKDSKYDVRTHFCDNRKNTDGETRVYKFKTFNDGVNYSETWMLENLDFDNTADDESRCYNDDSENCKKYGHLYTWDAANTYCPTGWRLPTMSEYKEFIYAGFIPKKDFNVQLGGRYYGTWAGVGAWMELWTADIIDATHGQPGYVNSFDSFTFYTAENVTLKKYLYSVRCIKKK
ncbi:MAG: hypothetical protein II892_03520 [Fibrobacter sp.]|nr:hypothetical protein [Fibrobacter sp.]